MTEVLNHRFLSPPSKRIGEKTRPAHADWGEGVIFLVGVCPCSGVVTAVTSEHPSGRVATISQCDKCKQVTAITRRAYDRGSTDVES